MVRAGHMDELPLDGDKEGRHRRCSRQRDQPGQRPGGERTVGGLGELSTQLPLRCREQGLAPGRAEVGEEPARRPASCAEGPAPLHPGGLRMEGAAGWAGEHADSRGSGSDPFLSL